MVFTAADEGGGEHSRRAQRREAQRRLPEESAWVGRVGGGCGSSLRAASWPQGSLAREGSLLRTSNAPSARVARAADEVKRVNGCLVWFGLLGPQSPGLQATVLGRVSGAWCCHHGWVHHGEVPPSLLSALPRAWVGVKCVGCS